MVIGRVSLSLFGIGRASLSLFGIGNTTFPLLRSCSHNGVVENGWWEVALPEPTNVKYVVVYNRNDAGQDRINGARVLLDGEQCGRIWYKEGQDVYVVCE